MPVFRVEFKYVRTVVTHLEADSEEDIHDFLVGNEDWDILDDPRGLVDQDESDPDPGGDYDVMESKAVTANYRVADGDIVEVES